MDDLEKIPEQCRACLNVDGVEQSRKLAEAKLAAFDGMPVPGILEFESAGWRSSLESEVKGTEFALVRCAGWAKRCAEAKLENPGLACGINQYTKYTNDAREAL